MLKDLDLTTDMQVVLGDSLNLRKDFWFCLKTDLASDETLDDLRDEPETQENSASSLTNDMR